MSLFPRHLACASLRAGLIALTVLLAPMIAAEEVIYTWTDDDGVQHFSAQPPEGQDYRIVDSIGAGAEAFSASENDEPRPSEPPVLPEMRQAEPDPEVVRERCEQARSNLEFLLQDRPALLQQNDGEPQPMDEETRQQMIEETEDFIADWC